MSLDQTFFGLTSNYKAYLLNETYVCTKHIGFTRQDVMYMPVWERRIYLDHLVEEVEEQNKRMGNATSSSGGGKRKRRVST